MTPFGSAITVQSPVNNLLYSGKIDYHLTDNHLLTVRYAVDRFRSANVIVQTGTNISSRRSHQQHHQQCQPECRLGFFTETDFDNEARFVFYRFHYHNV